MEGDLFCHGNCTYVWHNAKRTGCRASLDNCEWPFQLRMPPRD